MLAFALAAGLRPGADVDLDYLYEARGPRVLPAFAGYLLSRWLPEFARHATPSWAPLVVLSHNWTCPRGVPAAAGEARLGWQVTSVAQTRRGLVIGVAASISDDSGDRATGEMLVFMSSNPPELPPTEATRTRTSLAMPARPPDDERAITVPDLQAVHFRLMLDLVPGRTPPDAIHIDPVAAAEAGFSAPIVQAGAVEALVSAEWARGSAGRIVAMHSEYRRPVHPGRQLLRRLWRDGDAVAHVELLSTDGVSVALLQLSTHTGEETGS